MRLVSKRSGQLFVVLAYVVALLAAMVAGGVLSGRHPLLVAAAADVVATAVVFAFSVALDNSSVYDPYWSVAPLPVAIYWASGFGLRQILVIVFLAIWGARLTANWALRWRGPTDEDFRYVEIRGKTGAFYWPASFFSVHLFPTAWVFGGLLPAYAALTRSGFGALDLVAALVTVSAIAIETIADLQLRRYLRSPHRSEDVLSTGLWAQSRHPNYLGEVLFWWGIFLFGVAAEPRWAWSGIGALAITLLFVLVSVPWMDRRMLARHPEWAAAMKRTPALFPWPRRR